MPPEVHTIELSAWNKWGSEDSFPVFRSLPVPSWKESLLDSRFGELCSVGIGIFLESFKLGELGAEVEEIL